MHFIKPSEAVVKLKCLLELRKGPFFSDLTCNFA
jgi:hypothetical protein